MLLNNPEWRISNLYHVLDKRMEDTVFRPNDKQSALMKGATERNVIVKGMRRTGVSLGIWINMMDECLFNPGVTAVVLMQDKITVECIFKNVFMYTYDRLPVEIKGSATVTEYGITFANGSSLLVTTRIRGLCATLLHVAEAEKMDVTGIPLDCFRKVFLEALEYVPQLDGFEMFDFRRASDAKEIK
jgi:hypothetical protein